MPMTVVSPDVSVAVTVKQKLLERVHRGCVDATTAEVSQGTNEED